MNEYLTTEEVFDFPDNNNDFQELQSKYNFLQNEFEALKKEKTEKEYELNIQIKSLKLENHNLKQSIISYQELIESYKKNMESPQEKETNSNLIRSNIDYLKKVTEIEKKNFLLEKEKEEMELIISELNAEVENFYNSPIYNLNLTKNSENATNTLQNNNNANFIVGQSPNYFNESTLDSSLKSSSSQKIFRTTKQTQNNPNNQTNQNNIQIFTQNNQNNQNLRSKDRKKSLTQSSAKIRTSQILEFDENDVRDLLQELEDSKREKAEISERALNMLTEKELTILELRTLFDDIKEKNEREMNMIKNSSENQKRRSVNLNYENFSNNSTSSDLPMKFQKLEEEFLQLQTFFNEKEKKWQIEREKLNAQIFTWENSHNSQINDLQTEISKLKIEISHLELEKNLLERQLDKDKCTIENEMDQYHTIIKTLEEQKISEEISFKRQINSLKNEIKDFESINLNLRENLTNLEKQLSESRTENFKKLEAIQEKFKFDLAVKDEELNELKEKIENLEKEKENSRKECERFKSVNENTINNYKNLMNQLKRLKEDNEMEVNKWKESFDELKIIYESEKNHLNNHIKELKIQLEEVESKASKPEMDPKKKYLKTRNSKSVVINLQDYDSEENLELLKEKIKTLQNEIMKLNSLNRLKENNSQNVFRLNGEIQILKKENEKLKKEFLGMKENFEKHDKELIQIKNEINQKNNKSNLDNRNSLKTQNTYSKLEVLKLEEKVKRILIENKFLTEQIEMTKKELENTIKLKDDHIIKLKNDLNETNRNFEKTKFEFSKIIQEKDSEIAKYLNTCKKLRMKYVQIKYKNNENGMTVDLKSSLVKGDK